MASHGDLADDEHADHVPSMSTYRGTRWSWPRCCFVLGGGTPLLAVLVDGQVMCWASRSTSDFVTLPVVVRGGQV